VQETLLSAAQINTTPSSQIRIEFFAEASGGGTFAPTFLGFVEVTTDGSGFASFSQSFFYNGTLSGDPVRATATDIGTKDTSEFSLTVNAM